MNPEMKVRMKHSFVPMMLVVALSGCALVSPPPAAAPTARPCVVEPAYEVTVDTWCGNGCDSYPVSHRMRDVRLENRRVVLNGTQRTDTHCVAQ